MNSKLYVGNLPFSASEDSLRARFGQFGTITDLHLASDRITGRPRGFAFVTFAAAEEAQAAIQELHGTDLEGRSITVNEARPREGGGAFSGQNPHRRS